MGWISDVVSENTEWVEFKINTDKHIYNKMKEANEKARNTIEARKQIKAIAYDYAKKHNDEFGNVFITQLEDVYWEKVRRNL